jgi:hypothetical protein
VGDDESRNSIPANVADALGLIILIDLSVADDLNNSSGEP